MKIFKVIISSAEYINIVKNSSYWHMDINYKLAQSSIILKEYVNKYAYIGLSIAISSILLASLIVSYQMTGWINLEGFIKAQATNPAIWMLDLTPFSLPIGDNRFAMG